MSAVITKLIHLDESIQNIMLYSYLTHIIIFVNEIIDSHLCSIQCWVNRSLKVLYFSY